MVISKNNMLLLLVFVLGSLAIVLRAVFFEGYYLSPDSKEYLGLAQNLLDGNGFFLAKGDGKVFFSVWPVGYPILVAGISMIFHTSVIWGSKILNIIFLLLILLLIKHVFKQHSHTYYFLLLWASYIEIFSFSWSEAAFIFGLLWFSYSVYFFVINGHPLNSISLFGSSLYLFLIRYIGGFSVCFVGVMAVYCFILKRYKESIALIVVLFFQTILVASYLYNNFQETGYITGISRPAAAENNLEMLISLLGAIFFEASPLLSGCGEYWKFIVSLIVQSIVVIVFASNFSKYYVKKDYKNDKFAITCLCVGLFYLVSIISLRWISNFDDLGYRFLAPGTFLLIISLVSHMRTKCNEEGFRAFSNCFIFMSLLSYIINVPFENLASVFVLLSTK